MTDDLMNLIKASIATMIKKEVENQIEDIKNELASDDLVLTTVQSDEVDTMIRDVINQELTVSVQVDKLTALMQLYSMKTYLEILKEKAEAQQVSLLESFKMAAIPTSTYYRAINGTNELRYDTAIKVNRSIENFHTLQQIRDDTAALRRSNRIFDPCSK